MTSPAVQRIRAYFAPVARETGQPTLFDPAQMGGFDLEQAPSPWVDLGWISQFTRKSESKVEALRTGVPAVARVQVRTQTEATVYLEFETWGKLQLALASGSQSLNLLATQNGVPNSASGGAPLAAVPLLSGSTATVLQVGDAATGFSEGELIAVDVDYAGEIGFIGSGVSGAYVSTTLHDTDYVRRVTFNVARIAGVNQDALSLVGTLPAGIPSNAMKISRVVGCCDREGASFFAEWSALFAAEGQQGERLLWYYPRLQMMQGAAEIFSDLGAGYQAMRLPAKFRALPIQDALDGENVVCFRSYIGGRA